MKKLISLLYFVVLTAATNGQVQPRLVLPVGYTNLITAAKFTPDCKYIIMASLSGVMKLHDANSGREILEFKAHERSINNIDVSYDSKRIVTASLDGTSIVFEVKTGKKMLVLKKEVSVIDAKFSNNGLYILASYANGDVSLFDSYNGNELYSKKCHKSWINSISFSFDDKFVLSASDDNSVLVWDAVSGREIQAFKQHKYAVNFAQFSPDANHVLTASDDSTARVFDIKSGKEVLVLKCNSGVTVAKYNNQGQKIITGLEDGVVSIWDSKSGYKLKELLGHEAKINAVSFGFNDSIVITASDDFTLRIWNLHNSNVKSVIRFNGKVTFASFDKDFKKIVAISTDAWDGGAIISDINGSFFEISSQSELVRNVQFDQNCENVLNAIGGFNSNNISASIWNLQSGRQLNCFKGHQAPILSASFFPLFSENKNQKHRILTVSRDCSCRIWDINNGMKILDFKESYCFDQVNFNYKSNQLISIARYSDTAVLWDFEKMEKIRSFTIGSKSMLSSAVLSPNDKFVLLSSYFNNNLILFEKETGLFKNKLIDDINEIGFSSADFSPDGNRIFSLNQKRDKISIWNIENNEKEVLIKCDECEFYSAKFSSDSKNVITTSDDKTIRIWDSYTGIVKFILKGGNDDNAFFADFSSNGKYIISIAADHKTILWDATTGKQLYTRLQLKNNDWLVYDEDNHFDGSEGAINYLYLTCGLEIIDLAQVKDSLWVPGLAGKIMRGEPLLINDKPAPKLSDLNICDLTPLVEELPKDAKGNLIFQITPRNGGLGETEVYINGNLTYKYQPEKLVKSKNKEGEIIYTLNLSKDSITPFLSGTKGSVNPVLVKCKIKGASIYSRGAEVEMVTETNPELPKLYAVFVGVNDYNNSQKESNEYLYKNLDYAAKDAGDLANMVEQSAHTLFKDSAFIYRLTGKDDIEPTKENLKKVLREIGSKAKANDILYIFFAGHGDIVKFKNDKTNQEKNEIRFMLQGADKRNKNTGGFGVDSLTDWCAPKNIKAQKRVFVFDACHSGQFIKQINDNVQGGWRGDLEEVRIRQLTSLKDKNGMMILAASSDNESAYEDPSLNQGVLTYHLLEAVKDSKDSTLQINKWFESTLDLVKEYATANNKKQTPETFGNGRFEIGNVNEQVRDSIKIGAPKARIGNSVFIDATGKYPNLKKLINDHFKQPSSRGFISATSNDKAYYAEGSVMMDNGKLKILYTLYYGDTPIAEPFSMIELKGLSEEEVVKKIIASVEGGINEYIKKSKK